MIKKYNNFKTKINLLELNDNKKEKEKTLLKIREGDATEAQ